MEDKNKKVLQEAAGQVASSDSLKQPLIVKLYDSYMFNGEEVKEIDLTGLYDMTAEDMFLVDEQMRRKGYSGSNPEITRLYALFTAAKINHKAWEWCNTMRARDAVRIKNVVSGFFYMPG
jgi:hypothetical protein